MLDTLLKRYKSRREIYADFYEKELLQYRHKPINLLQVGVENSIPALHKFLLRANIYCIDKFDRVEPKKFKFLENTRIFWSRCDIDDEYIDELLKYDFTSKKKGRGYSSLLISRKNKRV